MKRLVALIAVVLATSPIARAHGDNDHVRGTVTAVSAQSITLQLTNKTTKTLTVDGKTKFERAGKQAALGDLKVGDRVVVDVPKNTSEALLVQFGAAPKKP